MTFDEFKVSLQEAKPPKEISNLLAALWHDAHGNWDAAHNLVQDIDTTSAAWIHAYLHRKEGDRSNAQYWYYQANKKMPTYTLEQEWQELVNEFL